MVGYLQEYVRTLLLSNNNNNNNNNDIDLFAYCTWNFTYA